MTNKKGQINRHNKGKKLIVNKKELENMVYTQEQIMDIIDFSIFNIY